MLQDIACDTGYTGTVRATCGSNGTFTFDGTCTLVRRELVYTDQLVQLRLPIQDTQWVGRQQLCPQVTQAAGHRTWRGPCDRDAAPHVPCCSSASVTGGSVRNKSGTCGLVFDRLVSHLGSPHSQVTCPATAVTAVPGSTATVPASTSNSAVSRDTAAYQRVSPCLSDHLTCDGWQHRGVLVVFNGQT
jgi:hypothetical protein